MPNASEQPPPRRVVVDHDGPVLVEGPVEVVTDDGTVHRSDRFVVALCTCRRSRTHPWCDTSHRAHKKPPAAGRPRPDSQRQGSDPEDTHDGDSH